MEINNYKNSLEKAAMNKYYVTITKLYEFIAIIITIPHAKRTYK